MAGKAEIEIARLLFEEGWGGADSSAPLQYMTDDVVMRDILGHAEALRGHEAVQNFWQAVAGGLRVMPEDELVPPVPSWIKRAGGLGLRYVG